MTRPLGGRGPASTGWIGRIRRQDGTWPFVPETVAVTVVPGTATPVDGALAFTRSTLRSELLLHMHRTAHVHA
ncbi:hypothetical protein SAMN04489712_10377 [Thermomonospora echinospora]|uniref:Uncharacterized protein n=1 Tax=Thermomonospora echinospora TaxID=1992 RepID=A0A1H5X3M2_9ACTN|nr:hypothetical protein SAMN04489712_10377 [Thermomonospora echinospora]